MPKSDPATPGAGAREDRPAEADGAPEEVARKPRKREIGGADGLEPTRYGDWERNGRCTDF